MSPLLLVLPGNEAFADALARRGALERSDVRWHHFPDGESLLSIDGECAGREVALLASLRDPDPLALPLRFLARTAREFGARRVGLVAPYLAYMRQDARFRPGEVVSAVQFADFLGETVDWLVTVDPHLHRYATMDALFRIPALAVSAMPAAADWIRANVGRPLLVGPDRESEQWVAGVADGIGAPYAVLSKRRHGDRDVEVSLPDLAQVSDRTPVLVDDIASSGRTLIETMAQLRRLGLPAPVCVIVHGIFADGSDAALLGAGAARLATSNTLPHPSNAFDAAPAVWRALQTLGVADASPVRS